MGKLNREVKIGLSIILGLLVIFGGVLTWRLTRPAEVAAAASASPPDKDTSRRERPSLEHGQEHRESPEWTPKPTLLKPEKIAEVRSASYESAASPIAAVADDRNGRPNELRQAGSALMQATSGSAVVLVNQATNSPPVAAPSPPTAPAVLPSAAPQPTAFPSTFQQQPTPREAYPAPGPSPRNVYPMGGSDATAYSSPPPYAPPSTPNYRPGSPAPLGVANETFAARNADSGRFADTGRREDGTYEVQPNENYWTISEKLYGTGAYFRALAEHNRGKAVRPDRLSPGLVVSTPPVAQLEHDFPDLCPKPNRREAIRNRAAAASRYASATGFSGGGRTYIVQEGDTLSSIARNELGKVSRWAEIYDLNRTALGKDFDYLTPGMQLVLPSRESRGPTDRTARGPGGGYER